MLEAKQKRKRVVLKSDICNMSTAYKVFLHEEGEEVDEIRRFVIHDDACTSFVCVQKKLEDMYPKLKDKTFVVTWKDDANDMVTIANDEDLILALTEMSGPPYNIYVRKGVVKPKVPSRRRTVPEWENIIKEQVQKAVDQKDILLEQVIQERDALRRDLDRAGQTIDRQQTFIENIVGSQQKSRPLNSLGIQSDDLNNALSILGAPVPGTTFQTDKGGLEHNKSVQLQRFLISNIDLILQRRQRAKFAH
ncbi:hypothetical protein TCAL_04642 [Tigriopus californicus]|uniref:PB1 domain-containing protein n=1 Tax=Tigriopus californicus TaxID=6832 RepID=A0A553NFN3_TIGCA|nr:uncharacterized protein LOC131888122 [Tigriopus californicus]TRY64215.1 hypothetical protein TCAL_04642 [Tigriopus californicus]|eukprot:TCALIF_04642-PA protein Name:"Protein of unknown function" AED:0.00 eAED:0.00 QI:265/1/1/1/1/1/2/40/248